MESRNQRPIIPANQSNAGTATAWGMSKQNADLGLAILDVGPRVEEIVVIAEMLAPVTVKSGNPKGVQTLHIPINRRQWIMEASVQDHKARMEALVRPSGTERRLSTTEMTLMHPCRTMAQTEPMINSFTPTHILHRGGSWHTYPKRRRPVNRSLKELG